jgi:hypothetical protein
MKPPTRERRELARGRATRLLIALVALGGCGPKASGKTHAAASVSAESAPTASATSSASAPEPQAPPSTTGTGVGTFVPADKAGCATASADIATYLQRSDVAMAVQKGEVAISYLIQLHGNEAQIGFAGYDAQAKRLGRDRGIGTATEHVPAIFAGGGKWIVTWLDDGGLAYARPQWEAELHLAIEHLSLAKDVAPDDLSLTSSADGALLAISPYGTAGDQLTLFRFAVPGKAPEAIGITKQATHPHHPVVAADADGFAAVWVEADGHLQSTRFDANGKPSAGSTLLVGPGKRADISIMTKAAGFQLVWSEGENVLTLGLTKDAEADGSIQVVGKGHWPRAASSGDAVYVAFVGDAGGKPEQLLVTKLPATTAIVASDGLTPVKDPPSFGVVGTRVALTYTEAMSPAVSSRRAILKTLDAACIK